MYLNIRDAILLSGILQSAILETSESIWIVHVWCFSGLYPISCIVYKLI